MTNKKTTEQFVKEARNVHKNKDETPTYRYDGVSYINGSKRVTITCLSHGDFEQTPHCHLMGHGCPRCGLKTSSDKQKKTTEQFIQEAQNIHKNEDGSPLYRYDKVGNTGSHKKVVITCLEHGDFIQTPANHLSGRGCQTCGAKSSSGRRRKTTEQFIQEAQRVHKNEDGTPLYGYSMTEYANNYTKVTIECFQHGVFEQIPSNHIQGSGCSDCRRRTKISKNVK